MTPKTYYAPKTVSCASLIHAWTTDHWTCCSFQASRRTSNCHAAWSRGRPAPWPECPFDPGSHPLEPVVVAGTAVWRCSRRPNLLLPSGAADMTDLRSPLRGAAVRHDGGAYLPGTYLNLWPRQGDWETGEGRPGFDLRPARQLVETAQGFLPKNSFTSKSRSYHWTLRSRSLTVRVTWAIVETSNTEPPDGVDDCRRRSFLPGRAPCGAGDGGPSGGTRGICPSRFVSPFR